MCHIFCLCQTVLSENSVICPVVWPQPSQEQEGLGNSSSRGFCSWQAQRSCCPPSQGRAPTHLPHYQGLMEASSSSCLTLEPKQPLPTIPAPFQPMPSSSRCCLLSQHSSCSERTHHKSSVTLLLILSPSLVLLRWSSEWQVVGSSTYFLLDGDTKYLLSEIFAAAPLQLPTSAEMLKKGGEMLLCLHSPLSFARMTQKLLGSVALPWRASHGQHRWWISLWFHWKMPTGVDLHSWFLIHTRPLLGNSFH